MPAVPVRLLEPLWDQFSALLPERPVISPTHPLGWHRHRIPDRVVFEHVIAALVHGSGYERIASPDCSDATIRRRLKEWAAAGVSEQVHTLALQAYDRMIGLELDDLAVDGCITKAPSEPRTAEIRLLAHPAHESTPTGRLLRCARRVWDVISQYEGGRRDQLPRPRLSRWCSSGFFFSSRARSSCFF